MDECDRQHARTKRELKMFDVDATELEMRKERFEEVMKILGGLSNCDAGLLKKQFDYKYFGLVEGEEEKNRVVMQYRTD